MDDQNSTIDSYSTLDLRPNLIVKRCVHLMAFWILLRSLVFFFGSIFDLGGTIETFLAIFLLVLAYVMFDQLLRRLSRRLRSTSIAVDSLLAVVTGTAVILISGYKMFLILVLSLSQHGCGLGC